MKRFRFGRYTVVLVLLAALFAGCTGGGAKVLATVNGENITERQLRTQAGLIGFLQQTQLDVSDDATRRTVMLFMAREQLLLQEAARRRLTPDPDFVETTRMIVQMQYAQSSATGAEADRDLAAALKPYGVTVSDLDLYLNRYATIIALEDAVVAEAEVTEEEARAFFDENPALFTTPEQRRASHILIKGGEGAERTADEAEAIIRELEAELRQDVSRFAELAKEWSEDEGSAVNGGDLDFFSRGRMVPEFEEAAFTTPVGELSAPVQTVYGWHIILVTDERTAGPLLFDDIKDELQEELRRQKGFEAFNDLLENLKENATYTPADLFQEPANT